MDNKELRVGNFVKYKGTEYIATVDLIHGKKHFDCRDEYGSFTPNGEYEPIPITEEWLLKLGFIHDIEQNKSYYSNGKLTINIPDNYHKTGRTYFNSWAIIEYSPKTVHHLMNIYHALTQEELCLKP